MQPPILKMLALHRQGKLVRRTPVEKAENFINFACQCRNRGGAYCLDYLTQLYSASFTTDYALMRCTTNDRLTSPYVQHKVYLCGAIG